jgi:hypothetical protein
VRRKFYDFHQATGSPIAAEALCRIAEIYAIEGRIRGRPPEARQRIRQAETKPLVEAMKTWLETELGRISAKSALAGAIGYALRHWQGLCVFLEDGRVETDTNTVERAIRPIKLGRKNHLFAGSDGGAQSWATVASLIQTAKLNDVEPFAYLRDVLERIVSGSTKTSDLASLLPWAWKAAQAQAAVRSCRRGAVATLTSQQVDRANGRRSPAKEAPRFVGTRRQAVGRTPISNSGRTAPREGGGRPMRRVQWRKPCHILCRPSAPASTRQFPSN